MKLSHLHIGFGAVSDLEPSHYGTQAPDMAIGSPKNGRGSGFESFGSLGLRLRFRMEVL